jgi:hypothetical protein
MDILKSSVHVPVTAAEFAASLAQDTHHDNQAAADQAAHEAIVADAWVREYQLRKHECSTIKELF